MMERSPPNDGWEYREQVGPAAGGCTVQDYLSRRYGHSSAAEWEERIRSGRVRVNGLPARCNDLLNAGAELVWKRPPWVEPEAPRSFTLLYEDEDVLAVAKPAGLPTLPGAQFVHATLLHLVRAHAPDAAPVHRLGRWTSGIVLCSRNRRARTSLLRQWSSNAVVKRYRALAAGLPPWDELAITTPIGPVPHPLLGQLHAASAKGKPSRSEVVVLERREGSFLCDVRITTGRPHQVRIHLAAAGHPLAGDPLYGPGGLPAPGSRALPGDPGYLLHAAELSFPHPADGRRIVLKSDPPRLLRRPIR